MTAIKYINKQIEKNIESTKNHLNKETQTLEVSVLNKIMNKAEEIYKKDVSDAIKKAVENVTPE